jgi:hypothetical protein
VERSAVALAQLPLRTTTTLPFVISIGAQRSGETAVCLAQPPLRTTTTLPFVISTGAQRSGEICGCPHPLLAEVAPCRVRLLYQFNFLFSSPTFDLLFSTNGIVDILKMFKPYESMTFVGGGEARKGRVGVLVRSTFNIVGDTGIENMRSAGYDVDVVVVVTLMHSRVVLTTGSGYCFLPSGVAS